MICDTCGKETDVVSRVVIDKGYNRANSRPIYNCPDCFERKNKDRQDTEAPNASVSPVSHQHTSPGDTKSDQS